MRKKTRHPSKQLDIYCHKEEQNKHFSAQQRNFIKNILSNKINTLPLHSQNGNNRYAKQNGALDEWLSHRSAKPFTPVRIGYPPHKKKGDINLLFLLVDRVIPALPVSSESFSTVPLRTPACRLLHPSRRRFQIPASSQ